MLSTIYQTDICHHQIQAWNETWLAFSERWNRAEIKQPCRDRSCHLLSRITSATVLKKTYSQSNQHLTIAYLLHLCQFEKPL